jgi:hypothetical protein
VRIQPAAGKQWNIWELERAAREHEGANPERAQEWSLLLMNLRQYANPEGTLPADFDELVRESFGELIESASIP